MRALGPIRLGMTVKEASAANGKPLKIVDSSVMPGCKFSSFTSEDAGFWVGNNDGRIHTICVMDGVSTVQGIRTGDSAKKLNLFPAASLKSIGEWKELQPTDPQDRGYSMLFKVMNGKIFEICIGKSADHAYERTGGC